ncbi:MAG: hypothetical protein ACD_39C01058G0003 [uncultured bacterium]|nr:MAG: hypothetical protein ACD_39C01058G0003 [uncultured bacterium]
MQAWYADLIRCSRCCFRCSSAPMASDRSGRPEQINKSVKSCSFIEMLFGLRKSGFERNAITSAKKVKSTVSNVLRPLLEVNPLTRRVLATKSVWLMRTMPISLLPNCEISLPLAIKSKQAAFSKTDLLPVNSARLLMLMCCRLLPVCCQLFDKILMRGSLLVMSGLNRTSALILCAFLPSFSQTYGKRPAESGLIKCGSITPCGRL